MTTVLPQQMSAQELRSLLLGPEAMDSKVHVFRGTPMVGMLEERRKERDARAFRSTRAGIAGRVVSMVVRLVVVPLSIGVLGAERYGLWASAWSLINWLGLSEAGIGAGLVNAIGRATGEDDVRATRSQVGTAVLSLGAVGLTIALGAMAFAAFGPVPSLLGVGDKAALGSDARLMVAGAGVIMGLTLVGNVVPQTLTALQEQYVGIYGGIAGSLGVLGSLAAVRVTDSGPVGFVLAVGLPPIVSNALLGAYVLWRTHPELRFSIADASWMALRELIRVGGMAFVVQLGELALVQTANILIANRLGPQAVTPYAVTFSLLYSGMYFVNYLVQPLWAAYAEAWARRDLAWIRQKFQSSIRSVTTLSIAGFTAALALGRPLVRLWAGSEAVPEWALLASMCAFFLCWVLVNCVGILASGLGLYGRRGAVVVVTSLGFVAVSWMLLPRCGVPVIPYAGITVLSIQGLLAWRQARDRLGRDSGQA